MWRIPVPLIAGGGGTILTIDADTDIGNLWDFFDNPAGPVAVDITVDNADVGNIYIPADFAGGSTFQFTAINGGRFLGDGGNGGVGGDDLGATGEAGTAGGSGSPAIASENFAVNIDIDDGFLLGGGGGGGGAATADRGATSDAGGGGGGGRGYNGGSGGSGGSGSVPTATPGDAGSRSAAGAGGAGGGTDIPSPEGGAGGGWGSGGELGYHDSTVLIAGRGGRAGNAFLPVLGSAAVTFNGGKSEATLRSESRVIGETDGLIVIPASDSLFGSDLSAFTLSWVFQSDGELEKFSSLSGSVIVTGSYWRDTSTGSGIANFDNSLYEVALVSGTKSGTYDASPGADGTYFATTVNRTWSITDNIFQSPQAYFEVRRTAAAGGGAGTRLNHGYLILEAEDGS